jgi:hypothetical protein
MKRITLLLLLAFPISGIAQTVPISCTGTLSPFTDITRGEITSKIISAKNYYFGTNCDEGSFEARTSKVNAVIRSVFTDFITKRTQEYKSIVCHYRGTDHNRPDIRTWKTISCQPGFVFLRATLRRTMNGDWKEGPIWSKHNTALTWKTGGYRSSSTFAEVDAMYSNIDQRVIDELNTARKILHDSGIPTTLPQ